MADFKKAFKMTNENEGGYKPDEAEDEAGETYAGIGRNFNPEFPGWALIDNYKSMHGPIRKGAKLNIPELDQMIFDHYKKKYWSRMYGEKITNQGIAMNLYDFFVNTEKGAARAIQRALNKVGSKIEKDGIIGPKTVIAINSSDPVELNNYFNEERIRHYKDEVIRRPAKLKNLAGWLNRVEKFKKLMA